MFKTELCQGSGHPSEARWIREIDNAHSIDDPQTYLSSTGRVYRVRDTRCRDRNGLEEDPQEHELQKESVKKQKKNIMIFPVLGEFTKCETRDAKIAMALKRILKNTNFRRKAKKKKTSECGFPR